MSAIAIDTSPYSGVIAPAVDIVIQLAGVKMGFFEG